MAHTLTKDQHTVLACIDEMGTHVFYTVEFVHKVEDAFGFTRGQLVGAMRANTGEPKGLQVEGVGRGATVQGASSLGVVRSIARKLGVEYHAAYGRGTEQRNAMKAIRAATEG